MIELEPAGLASVIGALDLGALRRDTPIGGGDSPAARIAVGRVVDTDKIEVVDLETGLLLQFPARRVAGPLLLVDEATRERPLALERLVARRISSSCAGSDLMKITASAVNDGFG